MRKIKGAFTVSLLGGMFLVLAGACGDAGPLDAPQPTSANQSAAEPEATGEVTSEFAANDCRSMCNAQTPCTTPCIVDAAQTVSTTCGGAGQQCKQCVWKEVSRTQIGANDGGLKPLWCNWWVTFSVTKVDTCSGAQITTCDHYQDGFGVGIDCCKAFGCWGVNHC
jgi:hypothetical protein